MSAARRAPSGGGAVRRVLLWWFDEPAVAHVSLNFAVDVGPARAYLERLAAQEGPRVSLQHLLVAAIGRVLQEFPLANAQIRGRRILRREQVGVAMPVNLLGHPGEARRELGLALVEDAGRQSLREIAAQTAGKVRRERQGESTQGLVAFMVRLAEGLPAPLFFRGLDGFDRLRRAPLLGEVLFRAVPATTLLSNAGAPFQAVPGLLFRGAALSPPPRLVHAGTVWGCSTVQDEAIVVDGRVEVRPMLPLLLLFDHRLIDGVMAGRLALRFAELLREPARAFGEDGRATAAAPR